MSPTPTPRPTYETPADKLEIAGLVPLSTVDWPDHLVASVFTQGCPWTCTYCQNTELIPFTAGFVPWQEVVTLLTRRRGLLDGVVFTGGEATRQAALPTAMKAVRDLGYAVGLHTAGCYPTKFANVLPYVDWVGLDIKSLPDAYTEVVGRDVGCKPWQCLDTLLDAARQRVRSDCFTGRLEYEVRTTVYPGMAVVDRFDELLSELRSRGVTTFALQEARTQGTSLEFAGAAADWDIPAWHATFTSLAERARAAGFDRVTIREA